MPTCKSCSAKVVRTDAFCGTCGEPVPGAKPVVPIARASESSGSGTRAAPERLSANFAPVAPAGSSARAVAVVALSEPERSEPVTELNETAIREREASGPASVLPLKRRKDATTSEHALEEPSPLEAAAEEARTKPAEQSTSLANMPVPAGPPILASDLLREQMRPSNPGERSLRWASLGLCGAGAVGALLVGGTHPLALVSVALMITMAILGLTPMSYRGRAIALLSMGAVATGVALWQQSVHGISPEGIILAGATIVLSGSLLFRAYYRGAVLSRAAVAIGVVALGLWFLLSGGHESLVAVDGHWQSWAPATTHMLFGLLAMLALMAFMDSSTRGGCHVWGVALLVLYAVYTALLIGTAVWPAAVSEPSIEGFTIAALIAGAVGTIIAGVALAQVLVATYQVASSRRSAAR